MKIKIGCRLFKLNMIPFAVFSLFPVFTQGAFLFHLNPSEKIVGGVDTDVEQVPYQVALEWQGEQFCGGSIITSKHILTAAHCIYMKNVEDVTIRIGATQIQNGGLVIPALNFTHHPNYTYWSLVKLDCDVSIIELAEGIEISNSSRIIPLTDSEPIPGYYVTASGWGDTKPGGNGSEILQSTKMIVVDREECLKIYGDYLFTEHMFCAGDVRGTCKGDSGGPVTIEGPSRMTIQVGITSWGEDGCAAADYPGVYTNIAHPDIKNFIFETIGVEKFN